MLGTARVETKGGATHRNVRRGWIGIDCVYCSPGTRSFYLGLCGRAANCWRCGPLKLGSVLKALGVPDRDARKYLSIAGKAPSQRSDRESGVYRPPTHGTMGRPHLAYLRKRGFDPEELTRLWGVGGIGVSPEPQMSWRLFVPVRWNGKDVSWTTRSLTGDGLRWFTSTPGRELLFHKNLLYGWDYVGHAAVVHEGCTDVWRTGPGAVGTFGVGFSDAQVLLLSRLAVRVICFDSEPKAQRRARRLCNILSVFPGETYLVTIDSPDPGCATARETKYLRRHLT